MKAKVQVINKITAILMLATFSLSSPDCYAQDKNMLARVAYEEAEKAYEAGDISTAYDELKKVDEHLGKVTPKSQFLRVQVWSKYAERNGDNIDRAIDHCKTYLAMDKSFDLLEEKKLEITRLLVKLEKEKTVYDKKKAAVAACALFEKKLEAAIPLRDESKIKLLAPFDFNLDFFEALNTSGSYSNKQQNLIRKNIKAESLTYTNKLNRYTADSYDASLYGSKYYIHKNLGLSAKDRYVNTIDKKSIQQVGIDITADDLEPIIQKITSLLGFDPDKRNNDAEESDAYWLFENYTVVIKKWRPSANYNWFYHLVIVKHFPAKAKLIGPSPKTSCTTP